MKTNLLLVAAVCCGTMFGACFRDVVSNARAAELAPPPLLPAPTPKPVPRVQYKIVGASRGESGYQADFDRMAAEGWRYTGPLQPNADNPMLIFERQR